MAKRSSRLFLIVALCLLVGATVAASRLGFLGHLQHRFVPELVSRGRLSPGDFPAGVAAPMGEIASVPLRPTRIGFTPSGLSAALLLAAGTNGAGIFKTGYALDARAVVFTREEDLKKALILGGDRGGVDLAALGVDRLAQWATALRDAAPRTVLLLGRSQGQEALGAVGLKSLGELGGLRLGVDPQSSAYFFALWLLSRAGLASEDVQWVELQSSNEAGRALRESRVDAAVGFTGDIEQAVKDRDGAILATTADAPHLIATVLVARGEFAARYPDAVRRALRGLLDAGASVAKEPTPSARLLGEVAPYLGDPRDAIRSAPPATLQENLSFFGLFGEAPVTYDELYESAAALMIKLGRATSAPRAEDTRDLGALKYVAEARGP